MPVLRCTNGTSVSVQAGSRNYSKPRDDIGPYSKFELGFPSDGMLIDAIRRYPENPDQPYDTVYCWVPRAAIAQLIKDNGGLTEGRLP